MCVTTTHNCLDVLHNECRTQTTVRGRNWNMFLQESSHTAILQILRVWGTTKVTRLQRFIIRRSAYTRASVTSRQTYMYDNNSPLPLLSWSVSVLWIWLLTEKWWLVCFFFRSDDLAKVARHASNRLHSSDPFPGWTKNKVEVRQSTFHQRPRDAVDFRQEDIISNPRTICNPSSSRGWGAGHPVSILLITCLHAPPIELHVNEALLHDFSAHTSNALRWNAGSNNHAGNAARTVRRNGLVE